MKRLILLPLLAAVAFGFAACDCKKEAAAPAAAPATGNSELDQYMKDYDAFVNEYVEAAKAAKAGDAAKLQALATKAQEFAAKSQAITGKVTAEEAQKLQQYVLKQAERLQKAME